MPCRRALDHCPSHQPSPRPKISPTTGDPPDRVSDYVPPGQSRARNRAPSVAFPAHAGRHLLHRAVAVGAASGGTKSGVGAARAVARLGGRAAPGTRRAADRWRHGSAKLRTQRVAFSLGRDGGGWDVVCREGRWTGCLEGRLRRTSWRESVCRKLRSLTFCVGLRSICMFSSPRGRRAVADC